MTMPFQNKTVVPVYGVPGSGKTTRLLSMLDEIISSGADPRQIAFASFTRTASYEGRDRAAAALDVPKNRLRFFSTLHALAYHNLDPRPKIMDTDDYRNIADRVGGVEIRGRYAFRPLLNDRAYDFGLGNGDYLLSVINRAQSHMRPVEEFIRSDEGVAQLSIKRITPGQALRFHEAIEDYKDRTGKIDFSDMLLRGAEAGPLPITHAFIDEAQDLTNLQWRTADLLFSSAETIYVGGDDDQAIYDFSGGNSEVFRSMGEYPRTIKLEHSHRCPKKIFAVAEHAISHIEDRVPKKVIPQEGEGEVDIIHSMQEISQELDSGEWLFLVRQHTHADMIQRVLHDQYRYYLNSRGGHSIGQKQLQAIDTHEKLRRGEPVRRAVLSDYYSKLESKTCVAHGFKHNIEDRLPASKSGTYTAEELIANFGLLPHAMEIPWFVALSEINPRQREYIQGVFERGERSKRPRIKVATIHAAKGTQCDNVVVCGRLGALPRASLERGLFDEYRIAYVAVTRARSRLFLLLTPGADDWHFYREAFAKVMGMA